MTTTLAGYAPPGHVEPMNPSAVLKRQRIKAGVPQAELARRMNRDQAWVSRTERGAYAVSVADYLAWMQALGLTVSLEPVPDEDVIGQLREAIATMDASQVETLLTLAKLIHAVPPRILRGLVIFAESQAQADATAG